MQKIKKPFFSVITVVKNDEQNIEKTIKSIIDQNLKDFEYIIVDGNSNDQTVKKISKFKENINHFIHERDDGIYFAMNKGARIAMGKVICFVNSGDILMKDSLKNIKKKFDENINIKFVFGTVKRHYTKSTILKYGFNRKKLFFNFDFATSHSTGFYLDLNELKNVNYFDTKYKCSSDYDLYYKLIIKKNLIGSFTDKDQIIGEVASGGYSSKISFWGHLVEETRIRFDNRQNVFMIFICILNALVRKFLKLLIK